MFSVISIGFSFILSLQALFTLFWMLYFWEDPANAEKFSSPTSPVSPKFGFTALIPARHEDLVIADTIRSVANINYPESLKEIIVLCRIDDQTTFAAASTCLRELNRTNIHLVTFFDGQINKPHALNVGLGEASQNFVCIFDAEDQPHPDIYQVINSVICKEGSDIVQAGVELMNYDSHWFSVFNTLEYFFWYKSGLPFFHHVGQLTPLGGNTVFFRKDLLQKLDGWDKVCLTEDADIGIRATVGGAKISLVYDERHVTREETPDSASSFIHQRTRWHQGFIQILLKGNWLSLPGLRSKITAAYLLVSPFATVITFLYLPIGLFIGIFVKQSIPITLFSYFPFYIFAAQLVVTLFGLHQFSRRFHIPVPFYYYLRTLFFYVPYQSLIAYSSLRALSKYLTHNRSWEKTLHINAHRLVAANI